MALAVARRADNALENDVPPLNRDQVLARYRQLREICKRHHHEILNLISGGALLHQARRLGLADGKTLILDDLDEMNYVYDLVIHTAPAGRSRAIDRYSDRPGLRRVLMRRSSSRRCARHVSQFSSSSGATRWRGSSSPTCSAAPRHGRLISGSKAQYPRDR